MDVGARCLALSKLFTDLDKFLNFFGFQSPMCKMRIKLYLLQKKKKKRNEGKEDTAVISTVTIRMWNEMLPLESVIMVPLVT